MSLPARHELDGLCATFRSRVEADLAVEHLAQEYGIDPAHIYVEPVDDSNSSGIEASGGDCAAGEPTHKDRQDAPLHGAIQVTVPIEHSSLAVVKNALRESGAVDIEEF